MSSIWAKNGVCIGDAFSVALRRARSTLLVAALVGTSTGCSGGVDPSSEAESVSASDEALSPTSCAGVAADQTFSGKIDPAFVSPRTYNNCTKGYVVDLNNILSTYTGAGSGGCSNALMAVAYADTTLTEVDCPNYEVRAIFYHKVGSSWVVMSDQDTFGTYFGGHCVLNVAQEGKIAGDSYRIAGTARDPNGNTRKISFETDKPMFCH